MGGCAAVGCTNSSQKGYLMKHFPKDPARRREWLLKMKRTKWKPTDHSCLCEAHFEPSMWEKTRVDGTRKLKRNAVPTIFTFLQQPPKKKRRRIIINDDTTSSEESDHSSDSTVTFSSDSSNSSDSSDSSNSSSSNSCKVVTEAKKISSKPEPSVKQDTESNPPAPDTGKVYNPYSQPRQQPVVCTTYPSCQDVRFAKLPFYDVLSELLKPSSLVISSAVYSLQERTFFFYLTPAQTQDIIASRTRRSHYMYDFGKQVQLRFCLSETICEQEDIFPPNLVVKVNNRLCPLPAPLPTNKPGVESKRPSRPLDITAFIKLSSTMANTITVMWLPDFSPGFTITVGLVEKLTSSDLVRRLKDKGPIQADYTRSLIKEKLNEDQDSEIMTTCLRVSLLCPLGKMRMQSPCRATTCQHLQCFDASLFLQMNERKPTWSCPVCDKPALYNNLIIDGYFNEVLESPKLPSDVSEIELHKDGSWSIHGRGKESRGNDLVEDCIEIVGDDVDATPPEIKKEVEKPIEVVDLVLSDSDEEPVTDEETPNKMSGAPEDTIILLDSPSPPSSCNEASNDQPQAQLERPKVEPEEPKPAPEQSKPESLELESETSSTPPDQLTKQRERDRCPLEPHQSELKRFQPAFQSNSNSLDIFLESSCPVSGTCDTNNEAMMRYLPTSSCLDNAQDSFNKMLNEGSDSSRSLYECVQESRNFLESGAVSSTINQSELSDFLACLPSSSDAVPASEFSNEVSELNDV